MRSSNSPVSKPIAPIISSEMANALSRRARPSSVSAIETERSSSTRRWRVTRPGGGEPLEQRGERAAVERQPGAELAHGLVVGLPEQHHDQVLRIGQPEHVEHRPVAGRHRAGGGVQREAQLVVERHARRRQGGHGASLGRFAGTAVPGAPSARGRRWTRQVEWNRLNSVDRWTGDHTRPVRPAAPPAERTRAPDHGEQAHHPFAGSHRRRPAARRRPRPGRVSSRCTCSSRCSSRPTASPARC